MLIRWGYFVDFINSTHLDFVNATFFSKCFAKNAEECLVQFCRFIF